MNCVAILPNGQKCGREMRVLKSEKVIRNRENAYTFQCPYCRAVRVIAR